MKVLGLDPGSHRTGYALLEFRGDRVVGANAGSWDQQNPRALALASLAGSAREWLSGRAVDAAAVEGVFLFRNARSALALAEARGVLLSVLGAYRVPVFEYAPATVKKSVCGFGAASKEQVLEAIQKTVPGLKDFPFEDLWHDAVDAIALAVCHAAHARSSRLVRRGGDDR